MSIKLKLKDPELKARWLEALRSGEYKQSDSRLRNPTADGGFAYCCLGVLCNLIDPDGWGVKYTSSWWHDRDPCSGETRGRDRSVLPSSLARRIFEYPEGIRTPSLTAVRIESYDDGREHIAGLNDAGMTFADLADLIEEYL